MDGQVEVRLEPQSGRFDVDDDRWLDQVNGLVSELRAGVDGVAARRSPTPGTKGGFEAIILSVMSAGSLTAVVELVRSWLVRDRSRSLKVSWTEGGALQSMELSGSELDNDRFDDLVRVVTRDLAAGP